MNRTTKIVIAVVAVVAVAAIAFFGIRNQMRKRTGDETVIKIGAILPLTGINADAGNSVKVGLELGINDVNSAGKQKYQLICYDTKSEAKQAVQGFQKLNSVDKAQYYFTTLSDNSLAIKPLAISNKQVLFCLASHNLITKDSKSLVFRPINTGVDEAIFLTQYIKNRVKPSKILFYIFNTEAGADVKRIYEKEFDPARRKFIVYDDGTFHTKDITTPANFSGFDCILIVGYSPTMGVLVKNLREAGYKGRIIANLGFNNQSVIKAAGKYADGIWYNDYDFPYDATFYKNMVLAAQKQQSNFTALSFIAYSCVKLIDMMSYQSDKTPTNVAMHISNAKEVKINEVFFYPHPNGSITSKYKMRKISIGE